MMRRRRQARKRHQKKEKVQQKLLFGSAEPTALTAAAAATLLSLPGPLEVGDEEAEAKAIRSGRPAHAAEAEEKAMVDDESRLGPDDPLEPELLDAMGRMEAAMIELETKCGDDFTFIGDNIDFLVKMVGSSKSRRNKLYHWFHLIGS
jgi:hypothetical protein